MDDWLQGIYDLHIHTSPDVVPRKCSDLEAARRMLEAGMRGGALEGMELVREGRRRGCTMVLTHCDNPADRYSVKQQAEAVRLGAILEHSYLTTHYQRTSIEEIARQIRAVGCENVILTTDFGQPKSPYFDEGMALYARAAGRRILC